MNIFRHVPSFHARWMFVGAALPLLVIARANSQVCDPSSLAPARVDGEQVLCAGDLNGSLDDRLQSLGYQVISFGGQNGSAEVILASGLRLTVHRDTGWFEIQRGDELLFDGQLSVADDGDSLDVLVDFFSAEAPDVPRPLDARVSAGDGAGEVVLEMNTGDKFITDTVNLAGLHTQFATAAFDASFTTDGFREGLIAPELLRGIDPETGTIRGEAILLTVLAATRAEVIVRNAPARNILAPGFIERIHAKLEANAGTATNPTPSPRSDCLNDCNDTWDPIIQQAGDNLANAQAQAQTLRDQAQEAYQQAVQDSRQERSDCIADAQSSFTNDAILDIAIGVPITTLGGIVGFLTTLEFGGAGAIPAVVGGTAGTTGPLIKDAFDADGAMHKCTQDHEDRVTAARDVRDAVFNTADAMVAVARANFDDAVGNLADCADCCQDPQSCQQSF